MDRIGRSSTCLTSSWLQLTSLYNNSPLVLFLSHMNPVQDLLLCFFEVCFNILLFSCRSSKRPPSCLSTKILCALLFSFIRATCPAHLFLLDLTFDLVFGNKYKSWRFLVCSFLQTRLTYLLLGPYIFLSTMFSNNFTLNVRDQLAHTHVKQPDKIILQYTLVLMLVYWECKWEDKRLWTEW